MPRSPKYRSLFSTRRLVTSAVAIGALLAALGGFAPTAGASETATSGDGAALAVTPPMGWNDWAHYQCGYNEATILANANALVSTGLAAKGYNTVTIDDCWMNTSRDANGNLVANPTLFPDGMAYVGTYLHKLGLKFGIYEDAGTSTCGGYAGSLGPLDAGRRPLRILGRGLPEARRLQPALGQRADQRADLPVRLRGDGGRA